MPADQSVPDGKRAAWPHDDPSRAGWVFDGWFQGDVAYDFTKPVTADVTLTAKWGRWTTNPDHGPWKGATDVRLNSPTDPVRFAQVSAGVSHSVALGSDGNAYTWGANNVGQLGDGTTTSRSTPVMAAMPANVKFTQVSAGQNFSMGLDRDGRVWTWGNNSYGQLGRAPTSSSPANKPGMVAMPAGVAGFIRISAGGQHCLALDRDGNIWTWGSNDSGQLGRTTGSSTNPTPGKISMPNDGTAFADIAAGDIHSMGLTGDGTAWTWGWNYHGELGRTDMPTGSFSSYSATPGKVATSVRFTRLAAGGYHALGLAEDHTVYTWGSNENGQLGRTTTNTVTNPTPGKVTGLTGATDIGTGGYHSLAVTGTTTYAWGRNDYGQTGATGSGNVTTPTPHATTRRRTLHLPVHRHRHSRHIHQPPHPAHRQRRQHLQPRQEQRRPTRQQRDKQRRQTFTRVVPVAVDGLQCHVRRGALPDRAGQEHGRLLDGASRGAYARPGGCAGVLVAHQP